MECQNKSNLVKTNDVCLNGLIKTWHHRGKDQSTGREVNRNYPNQNTNKEKKRERERG